MAKGSQFWGLGSGKLGEQVLYRAGGEQRARTYVKKIKNPKTLAQMVNRISMVNLASVFRGYKSILTRSFPSRKENQSGFNAFMRANKTSGSPVVDKSGAQSGLSVPYNMIMSLGSLNLYGSQYQTFTGSGESELVSFGLDITNNPNRDAIIAAVTDSFIDEAVISTPAVLDKVLDAMGVGSDPVITVLVADYADEGFSPRVVQYRKGMTALPDVAGNSGNITLRAAETGRGLFLEITNQPNAEQMLAVFVSGRDGNGKLGVSTSKMVVMSQNLTYVEQFLPGGDIYQFTLEQYGYSPNESI